LEKEIEKLKKGITSLKNRISEQKKSEMKTENIGKLDDASVENEAYLISEKRRK
jgi:hypothetical protein